MGTSNSYGGPGDGLLPSWLDKPTPPPSGPPPAGVPPGSPTPPPQTPQSQPPQPQPAPQAPPTPVPGGSLTGARTSFTGFAGSGSRSKLDRSLSGYVRGVGGSRGATRRMGSSRGTAAAVLGFARDFQSVGPAGALGRFNLGALAGRPAEEVFTRLLDQVCPTGGTVDEAIARLAMLEAIDNLAEANIGAFEQLTPEQLEEFVADFISNTIEARVLNDIGVRGITVPEDVAAVDNIQAQLHDAISGCVRDALSGKLTGLAQLSNEDVARTVDRIYEGAFDLIAALAEAV